MRFMLLCSLSLVLISFQVKAEDTVEDVSRYSLIYKVNFIYGDPHFLDYAYVKLTDLNSVVSRVKGYNNQGQGFTRIAKVDKEGQSTNLSKDIYEYSCVVEGCKQTLFTSFSISPNEKYFYYSYVDLNYVLDKNIHIIRKGYIEDGKKAEINFFNINDEFNSIPGNNTLIGVAQLATNNLGWLLLEMYYTDELENSIQRIILIDPEGHKSVIDSLDWYKDGAVYLLQLNELNTVFMQSYLASSYVQEINAYPLGQPKKKIATLWGYGPGYEQADMQPVNRTTEAHPEGLLYYTTGHKMIMDSDGHVLLNLSESPLYLNHFAVNNHLDVLWAGIDSSDDGHTFLVKNFFEEVYAETGERFSEDFVIGQGFDNLSLNDEGNFTFSVNNSQSYGDVNSNGLFFYSNANKPVSLPLITTLTILENIAGVISSNVCSYSVVNANNRSVSESIPLVGVGFDLNYASERFRASSGYKPQVNGLGGWTPSFLHHYDVKNKIMYGGDGSLRTVEAVSLNGGYYIANSSATEVYFFDSNGRHIETRDALTGFSKWIFQYQTDQLLKSIADQFNNYTQFTYSNNQVIITSPFNQKTTLSFDANGFLASVQNPNNEIYTTIHQSNGLLTHFVKPRVNVSSSFTYDKDGYLLTDSSGTGRTLSLAAEYDVQSQTQTVSVTNAALRTTTYKTRVTDSGVQTTATTPFGGVSTQLIAKDSVSYVDIYNQSFNGTQVGDPRFGLMSSYLSSQTLSDATNGIQITSKTQKTVVLKDPNNVFSLQKLHVETQLQGNAAQTYKMDYDADQKLITSASPLNRVTYQRLNNLGQLSVMQTGNLTPIYLSYEPHGLLKKIQQGTRTQEMFYDQNGRLSSQKNSLGQAEFYEYDAANRVTKKVLPDGQSILMSYDQDGNIKSIITPNKQTHSFLYSFLDKLSSYTAPALSLTDSTTTSYTYTPENNIKTIAKPDATTLVYNYNSGGLLGGIATPEGNYTFGYKTDLLQYTNSPDSQEMGLLYLGSYPQQIQFRGPVTAKINLYWQQNGLLSNFVLSDQAGRETVPVAYAYDLDGLMTRVGDLSLTRNQFGAVSQTQLKQIQENITYDNYGEIVKSNQSILSKKSASTLFQQEFTRDKLGRVTSITQASVNVFDPRRLDYTYDLQGHLTQVFENQRLKVEYKYDANGNRVQKILGSQQRRLASDHDENRIQATYDEQDRLIKYGRNIYEYNRNGELQQKTELFEDNDEDERGHFSLKELLEKLYAKLHKKNQKRNKVTKYSYNSFGQLKTVTLPDETQIEYILSADGRRLGKKVNGLLTRRYVFQNQTQLAAELDENGAILKQFIYATKSNVADYMIYKGTTYKIISDQVGTPKLVVNANTGKVVEMLSYDEFGAKNTEGCVLDLLSFLDKESRERFKKEGSLIPFGFAGGLRDEDTGLVHFGARDYDPTIGRWTTKDPIGFNGGDTNLYGYVGGNPISFVDPSGLRTEVRCRDVSGTGGAASHCYLVIIPESGSSLGKSEITLSVFAQEGKGFLPGSTAVKSINDPRDSTSNYRGNVTQTMCGQSVDDFDKAILSKFKALTPGPYSNNPFLSGGVNNSNTFVQRVINAAGGTAPYTIPFNAVGF